MSPFRNIRPDAEAEVNQGRDADHEADEGVELVEGDDGEKAERTVIRHAVAEDGGIVCQFQITGFPKPPITSARSEAK